MMSAAFILILIGVVLIFVSAVSPAIVFGNPERPTSLSLWNLGWGFVLAGVFLVGGRNYP